MPSTLPHPHVDPDGLLEYSVVYTDRALNHMSARFQRALLDVVDTLKRTYAADAAVVMPGSGTFGMEAVARQFATDQTVLVLRHGWFSYRWSQILEAGRIAEREVVLKARRVADGDQAAFGPAPIDEIEAAIARERPSVVFAPHVETASGILLPDDWLRRIAAATHAVGGLFVLDAIASGCVWVDMRALGVDVLVSAPQKGWSAWPGCAMVMLSARALARLEKTQSTSFACDLKRWVQIMRAYEQGAHAYHATMPTDVVVVLQRAMAEAQAFGMDRLRDTQWALGRQVRALFAQRGFPSVAAPGFEAPGVVVAYTQDAEMHSGAAFKALGLQTAAGVPLQCDEGPGFRSFRVGLFGLDKLADVDAAVDRLASALDALARR